MGVNLNTPERWKADIAKSVDMYNDWFINFAPMTYRQTRARTTKDVEAALHKTSNMTVLHPQILRQHPEILSTLRMSTCPPLAVDRLIGLAGVAPNLVKSMEFKRKLPSHMNPSSIDSALIRLSQIFQKMMDLDIYSWLGRSDPPTAIETHRAATIVADRLCGSVANPIIRNAQEKRQLATIKIWLEARGYKQLDSVAGIPFNEMPRGTFSFHTNVPVKLEGGIRGINIPIDVVIMPLTADRRDFPIFFEAKSAGDFANTNKRRKEEAMKMVQLKANYGDSVKFNLFLCGYFDSGYLGYEAAEGIDWVWEHRVDDLARFGM